MTIKFLRDWRYARAGQTVELGSGECELLIQRGIAEAVPDEPAEKRAPKKSPVISTRRIPGPREK